MDTVRLSVIIAAYGARATIGACLESLARQTGANEFEVILIESSGDGTAEYVRQHFPEVRVLEFAERKFCGDARNIGVSRARADIVAFIDADCTAEFDWVEQILKAHQKPQLAVGGAIANENQHSVVSWGAYFTEFSGWLPAGRARRLSDIAGANMSYKKAAFDTYGRFIEGTYCSDTEFHWRLEKDQCLLAFEPSILIHHHSMESLGKYLNHEVFHGRSFARVRARAWQFSPTRRWLYALAFPLIAVKKFLEIGRHNLNNRIYLKPYLFSLPWVALGVGAWSVGEALGYLDTA